MKAAAIVVGAVVLFAFLAFCFALLADIMDSWVLAAAVVGFVICLFGGVALISWGLS